LYPVDVGQFSFVKLELSGTKVFQLDDAENGEVSSETIIPVPFIWLIVIGEWLQLESHAELWKRILTLRLLDDN
jgi:hypothetical protein